MPRGTLLRLQDAFRRLFAVRRATMFGTARIYDFTDGTDRVRVLDIGNTFQSATYVDDRWCKVPFPYLALFDSVFAGQHPVRNLCMLGGGGYAYPKQLVASHPEARIDVVEIDPTITQIAREFFFLNRLIQTYRTNENHRLGLVCKDALAFLQECKERGTRYDAILNDCFVAHDHEAALDTKEALATIRACLAPGGVYAINVITALEGEDAQPLMELVANLSDSFDHIQALTSEEEDRALVNNLVVFASDLDPCIPHAIRLYDTVEE